MVYYAVFYSTKDSKRVKNYAGEDKVDYICRAINEMGEDVIILSNAKTTEKKYAKREKKHLYESTDLLYFSSLPRKGIVLHAIDALWGYIQLFFFVMFYVKKNDTILVYHSLGYRGLWGLLRKIKAYNYVLEVEELFQTFEAATSSYKKHERNVFKYPDAFLFSNAILAKEINKEHKPEVIINGVYKGMEKECKKNPKVIKIVYAGSLEKQKGIDYVIPVAEYLPTNYEIHIIGFGSKDDICRVEKLIKDTKGKVRYDGVLKGDEYRAYMQSCNVGLCIQDECDEFNKYEYPSKVFSYLSNGLQVVANDLIQLRESEVFKYLHVVNSKNPKDIATMILDSIENKIDSKIALKRLDEKFKNEIIKIIRRK